MYLAPIALFTYNRPYHTQQTVDALQKNYLAAQSELIIFSDAPKNSDAISAVNQVRQYLYTIQGFNSIKIIERQENYGLAKSIIEGVTEVIKQYGKVIVLEDDIVTSPVFLDYMNYSLELYESDEKLMHISGYSYPIDTANVPDFFFVRPTTCWGWATWGRAWEYFNKDSTYYLSTFNKAMIKDFNLNNSYNYFDQIVKNDLGILNTWAVFWYASVYLAGGLSLHPAKSYVHNIGHDGLGENCGSSDVFNVDIANNFFKFKKISIMESKKGRKTYESYFRSIKPSIVTRIIRKAKLLVEMN